MLLGYLSADIICSEKRTVRERSSRKTVSYYCLYYSSNLFRNARSVENSVGNIFSDIPQFWGILEHVTCLDQSCASENI